MTPPCDLSIVTGAPGAGKSTTAELLLGTCPGIAVLDIDWLADPAGRLAGRSIHSAPCTWPAYGQVWEEVLHAVVRNGLRPLFFCPNTPEELTAVADAPWCRSMTWLLLDCSDPVREQRLAARPGWSDRRRAEALADAAELRALLDQRVDTGAHGPERVAQDVRAWATGEGATP